MALGLALIVKSAFPEAGEIVLSTIVATTVVDEIIGPPLTRLSLAKAGEI